MRVMHSAFSLSYVIVDEVTGAIHESPSHCTLNTVLHLQPQFCHLHSSLLRLFFSKPVPHTTLRTYIEHPHSLSEPAPHPEHQLWPPRTTTQAPRQTLTSRPPSTAPHQRNRSPTSTPTPSHPAAPATLPSSASDPKESASAQEAPNHLP